MESLLPEAESEDERKEWEKYLLKHGVRHIFKVMTAELVEKKPVKPAEFMITFLQKHFTAEGAHINEETKCDTKAAGKDSRNWFSRVRKKKESKEEGKDIEDEDFSEDDDEDDYVDEVSVVSYNRGTKRSSVMCKNEMASNFSPPKIEKSEKQSDFLSSVFQSIVFTSHLKRREIQVLVAAMKPISLQANTDIIKEGEDGDVFYVVEEGTCEITKEGVGKVMEIPCPSKNDPTVLRRYFGELALLYDAPRAATVTSSTMVKAWTLDRSTFKSILQDTDNKKIILYGKFIQSIPAFRQLTIAQTHTLCNALTAVDYDPQQVIIKEGDIGNDFFIIEDGIAECFKHVPDRGNLLANTYSVGDFFGELALRDDAPRAATVIAKTHLSLVKIDRPTFKRIIGNLTTLQRAYD